MVQRGYELFRNSRLASQTRARSGRRVLCRISWFVFSETVARPQVLPISPSPLIAPPKRLGPATGTGFRRNVDSFAGISALLPECRLFWRNPNISVEMKRRDYSAIAATQRGTCLATQNCAIL